MKNSKVSVDYRKHQNEARQFLTTNENVPDKSKKERDEVEEVGMDSRLKKAQADVLIAINKEYAKKIDKLEGPKTDQKIKSNNKAKIIKFSSIVEQEDCFEDFQKAMDKVAKIKAKASQGN